MTGTEIEVMERPTVPEIREELSVDELVAHVRKIQQAMQVAMRDGEHYGVIPGTDKPTLLKPGAEKLCLLFRLDPEYEAEQKWEGEHLTVSARCTVYHIPTGNRVASGLAMCSTKEAKYAYRNAQRVCPSCGAEAIIKGKAQYGGGWICWKKKDGCNTKFDDHDPAIVNQEVGRAANENLPDTYNTVVKMACKRALVAAVLNGTAASDIFTQDLDDSDEPLSGAGDTTAPASLAADRSPTQPAPAPENGPARADAMAKVTATFAELEADHTLPPGWKSWHDLGFDHIKNRYSASKIGDLDAEQLLEVAKFLETFKAPI